MSYPMYDRDFFEPCYAPQPPLGPQYDFYPPPPPEPPLLQEPVIPYGWRPDWTRPAQHDWHTANLLPNTTHNLVEQRQYLQTCATDSPEPKPTVYKALTRENSINKPFKCQVCGKCFSQAANLTAHKRVHTGEKPFECSVCNRPFSQSSSLVTHRRTHTGERPYPCKHCDKAFTDSSTLTKHLRTHTGQKPYGCPLCQMRFTQSGNLHRHMKTHRH